MNKLILWTARGIIIKKLSKYFGNQFINTVLTALELTECGIPKMKNPPPPPPKIKLDKVFRGAYNVDDDGNLDFVCNTKNLSFQEVESGLIKLRNEINRQIEQKTKCPFNPIKNETLTAQQATAV